MAPGAARPRRQRRPGRARRSQPRRQSRRCRRLEHRPHRQLGAQHRPDPAGQPDPSRECPPRAKKSSSGPTRSRPSRSAKMPHRISSSSVAGSRRRGVRCRAGGRQRRAVDLAVWGQGQGVEHGNGGGQHVLGQAGGGVSRPPGQHARVLAVIGGRGQVRGQPPARACLRGRSLPPGDTGAGGQHGLDFTGLDPEPPDLHLIISTPGRNSTPAAVHFARSPSGTSAHRRSRTGTPQTAPRSGPGARIPTGQLRPGDIHSPRGHSRRDRAQPPVQHRHRVLTHRAAHWHLPGDVLPRALSIHTTPDHRLGRPILIHHHPRRAARQPSPRRGHPAVPPRQPPDAAPHQLAAGPGAARPAPADAPGPPSPDRTGTGPATPPGPQHHRHRWRSPPHQPPAAPAHW